MATKSFSPISIFAFAILLLFSFASMLFSWQRSSSGVSAAQNGKHKIADWVAAHTADGQEAEFLVILADQTDLSTARVLNTKAEKGRFVRDTLLSKAQATQAPILDWLTKRGIEHRPYYIVNAIWVKGTREVAEALAGRGDVARIEGNPRIKNQFEAQPTFEEVRAAVRQVNERAAPAAIEPGVTFIRAPEVWATGFTGQGIVIGGADTGIRWDHNALKNHYRGWDGTAANHNYNWHDSIHSGGGSCGPNTTAPCDDDNHGTHTVGTALGDDGATNQIGVAPGAKFIGCRNMDQGNGQPSTYIECMEWFLAPYPIGGTPAQGDPTKAPDVTINSWGCPPSEGCSVNTLRSAVEAQAAAGIMMVVAAGNSGSSCSTVSDPPSFYAASYTVGAISSATGNIASFSSRGPAMIDGSNRLKPEITAPGVSVRSANRSGGYSSFSGTSMATPHTAGAIALLWSARPALRHQIQQTINVLNQAAVDVPFSGCSSSGVPNNVYGWGRLDIKAAVDAAAAACNYSIFPSAASAAASGGGGSVSVTTDSGCDWMAVSNAGWIAISSGRNGNGSGTVNYNVAANSGAQRSGTMTIAGQTFTVTQDASGCPSITISPATLPNGFTSLLYEQTLTQTGSASAITWSVSAGALPIGLSLSASGVLSGLPGTAGVYNFTVTATDANSCTGTRTYIVIVSGSGLMFYPLEHPVRLLDTRPGQVGCDAPGAPITSGNSRTQTAAGRSCDGLLIPLSARALTGNITTVQSDGGYLVLYPGDATLPTVANSNYGPNEILNNVFTVKLSGGDGTFKIATTTNTHVVVDVTGYFAPPAENGLYFHPLLKPVRMLDTRAGFTACSAPGTPMPGGVDSMLTLPGTCDGVSLPAGAKAIVGNITTVNPQGSGPANLTLFPADAARPLAASSNYLPGQTMNAPFTVGLSPTGRFKVYPTTQTDLVIDVLGYYSAEPIDVNGTGLLFNALPKPVRLLETRAGYLGCFAPGAPVLSGIIRTQSARVICEDVPTAADALAVVGNATVVNAGTGFLTFWPSSAAQPTVSTSNFIAGQVFNRYFLTGLGGDGAFKIFASATTDLVIDLSGYFAP
jgi:serine protease AprX